MGIAYAKISPKVHCFAFSCFTGKNYKNALLPVFYEKYFFAFTCPGNGSKKGRLKQNF